MDSQISMTVGSTVVSLQDRVLNMAGDALSGVQPSTLFLVLLIAAGVALSTALVIAWISGILGSVPSAPSQPVQAMPALWRLLPWPTHAAATWAAPLLGRQARLKLMSRLRIAGLEHVLSAERFVGGQCVSAAGCLALAATATALLGESRPWLLLVAVVLGWYLPLNWLRETIQERRRLILRALPFYLDVITLAMEAGCNMTGAIQHAVNKGPRGPLADEMQRLLRDVRAGRSRAEAFRALSDRIQVESVTQWVSAILAAERQGASLGGILRAQAEQRRNERFLRAEAMALKAPVKMLFPLMTCIFPCTFVIVFFPIVVKVLREGILG